MEKALAANTTAQNVTKSLNDAFSFIPGGLKNILNFGLMIGGAIALGTIIYGGIIYAMSGDNSSKQKEAKEWILAAVKGLAVIAFGLILLQLLNPRTFISP